MIIDFHSCFFSNLEGNKTPVSAAKKRYETSYYFNAPAGMFFCPCSG
jgi:hypothetical protein